MCENRAADQRRNNCEADLGQFLFFLNKNVQPLAIYCACTARFVSDLFGNRQHTSHNTCIASKFNSVMSYFPLTVVGRILQLNISQPKTLYTYTAYDASMHTDFIVKIFDCSNFLKRHDAADLSDYIYGAHKNCVLF